MANPELSQRIQELPEELLGLEREPGIAERLRRIDVLKDRARALDPLDGVEDMALADYDRDWLVRYTYNSNAIEGSTLTLEDTSLVLEGEFVPSDSPARYVFAARGVADGMAYVREYAREGRRLDEELVRRVHEVTALDLQPFARGTFRPYGYLADYDRDWLVRYTYNSNAIEGSTLTLEDTSLVLEGEFVPSDSPARYVFAARGVADGMAYVREYAREGRRLDEELVRRVHEVTALDLQPFARGTFRPYGYLARITATRVKTADPLEIRDDLRALIDGLDASGAHPLLRAAGFHAMFENIHPFMDGNGRTGRQLLNFMLLKHGYRPVAIKYDAKRDYARSLETWQVDGDPVAFCSVFLDCVEQEEHAFIELVEGLRRKPDAIRSKTDLLDRFGDTLRQNLARQDGDGKSAGIDHEGPGCHMSH